MGKHGKPVDCGVCGGKGGWNKSDDGNTVWEACWGCGGTGKQQ
ncbi:hypothetical protein RIF23_13980 [Lipingzhangella sp. LS1_29]|uniref:Molecular chaperone DnaJ n=1 Tax=Lipingzhangella rawalii TaxID=2055835 RepID=A0ABU2H7X7_9ACTN|nr:hypothetical protein [Lipingzhangella rawalii]MDS1271405.1 hypothetical protein [Lipingzhangella rawalii]